MIVILWFAIIQWLIFFCKVDAPGGFIELFSKNNDIYAYLIPGKRIDIGNLEDYNRIKL